MLLLYCLRILVDSIKNRVSQTVSSSVIHDNFGSDSTQFLGAQGLASSRASNTKHVQETDAKNADRMSIHNRIVRDGNNDAPSGVTLTITAPSSEGLVSNKRFSVDILPSGTIIMSTKQFPENLVKLLFLVIQWMSVEHLSDGLDMVEDLLLSLSFDLRNRIFEIFFRELSSSFDVARKERCLAWFMSSYVRFGVHLTRSKM